MGFSIAPSTYFNYLNPCRTCESRQPSGSVLNRFLSIFSDLIFDSSVDRGTPNFAAAPVGPNTRPRLVSRSVSENSSSISRISLKRNARVWEFSSHGEDLQELPS